MKKKGKKNGAELEMGYCPLSMRLGAGLVARHSDTARRRAGGAGGTQARRRRHGRAGAGRGASGRCGAGRAGRAGARGRWTMGRRAVGARGRRARAAGGRHGHAAGRHVGRNRRAGHGRLGCLGAAWACSWANWLCTRCTRPVFGPVRLGSFLSHQMNTVHCKINFRKNFFY